MEIFSRRTLVLALLAGHVLSLGPIFHFLQERQLQSDVSQTVAAVALYKKENPKIKTIAPLPVRIMIPKLGVDSTLEYVGLASDGTVDVPKGPSNAAWFDLGPRPGETGSSVIVGHYGWKNGIQAVFDDLHKLAKGDKLYVIDDKGATTTFVVRDFRTYGENDDASSMFMSVDGKAHLNLITCVGVWNKARKSYSERFAVLTDKEVK